MRTFFIGGEYDGYQMNRRATKTITFNTWKCYDSPNRPVNVKHSYRLKCIINLGYQVAYYQAENKGCGLSCGSFSLPPGVGYIIGGQTHIQTYNHFSPGLQQFLYPPGIGR